MVAIEANDPHDAFKKLASMIENHEIAERLIEIADLLADQQASEFRVLAYRNASKTMSQLESPVHELLHRSGVEGLIALPGVGRSIANVIEQYLGHGRIGLLDRLRGEATAEHTFSTLPNVGVELSHRIHDHLHVETLPELYAAAKDGRLQKVPGFGRKRVRGIVECLAQRLRSTSTTNKTVADSMDRSIPVLELLDVDAEYRQLAKDGKLPKVAPRKFNPGGVAWLPILHTDREGRHYTALFSNTARAHDLNTTKDWVVIYRDDAKSHGRWTVITSQFGKLRGCRIVRGREDECELNYFASVC